MYHISQDKRSRQSAQLIYDGLLKCMDAKAFDRVTITDVQKASGVARTTFYRCFDNTSDVLYWKCDSCFFEVLGEYRPKVFEGELQLVRHYFEYWTRHSDILELLVRINRQDIIYACHMSNAEMLQQRFGAVPGLEPSHSEYFMAIRTGLTISILTTWLKRGRRESPEELVDMIREQLRILADGSR